MWPGGKDRRIGKSVQPHQEYRTAGRRRRRGNTSRQGTSAGQNAQSRAIRLLWIGHGNRAATIVRLH